MTKQLSLYTYLQRPCPFYWQYFNLDFVTCLFRWREIFFLSSSWRWNHVVNLHSLQEAADKIEPISTFQINEESSKKKLKMFSPDILSSLIDCKGCITSEVGGALIAILWATSQALIIIKVVQKISQPTWKPIHWYLHNLGKFKGKPWEKLFPLSIRL